MSQPTDSLFREEALKHYLQVEEARGLVKISPPWTWALLWILMASLGLAIVWSFFGHIEVHDKERGIVRPPNGIRMLVSQSSGLVGRVEAGSNEVVKAGAILLYLNVVDARGQLLRGKRRGDAIESGHQMVAKRQDAAYVEQSGVLWGRTRHLQEQIVSYRASMADFEQSLKVKQAPRDPGMVDTFELDVALKDATYARQQLWRSIRDLNQAWQDIAALECRRQEDLWQRQQVVQRVEGQRGGYTLMGTQTEVRAPESGVVDTLLVRQGDAVQAGQVLGRLIPQSATRLVVIFVTEKDRASVRLGDEVRVELDHLPGAGFESLKGRVAAVSEDPAPPYEIQEALGENKKQETPSYRVEVEVGASKALDFAPLKLRTGTLVTVRYTRRRQRIITLIFEPLGRWFR